MTSSPPALLASRTILRIDSGVDHGASVSRRLADQLVERLAGESDVVVRRDVSAGLPFIDARWHAATLASPVDLPALAVSEELVGELLAADEVVLVAPVYNLGVPAALKCWIDHVVREGRTHEFTAEGPKGMVPADRAWIVTASGGTPIGGDLDFNTPYLRTILGVIGIHDVRLVAAESVRHRGEEAIRRAEQVIDDHLSSDATG